MEKKEFAFMGKVVNGFLMLFVLLALLIASAVLGCTFLYDRFHDA